MNTKLNCLIADDELPALAYLKALCERLDGVEVVRAFNDPARLLESAAVLDFNCCILDICMPGMSGLEVAKALQGKLVIFTTAHKEFAADAFDLHAVDYLRKPIEHDRFAQAIEKARQRLARRQEQQPLVFQTALGKTLVPASEVAYITVSGTDRRDKTLYTWSGQKHVLKTISFDQVLALLPAADFCRLNKKEVLALRAVSTYTTTQVHTRYRLTPGTTLVCNLSDSYRSVFLSRMRPKQ